MGYNSQSLIEDLRTAPADGRIQLFPCSNGVFYLKRPEYLMQGSRLIIRQSGQEVILDINGLRSVQAFCEALELGKPSTADVRRVMKLIDEALVNDGQKEVAQCMHSKEL